MMAGKPKSHILLSTSKLNGASKYATVRDFGRADVKYQ
jgi:hypothetical protein